MVREALHVERSGIQRTVTAKLYGHVASDERHAVHEALVTVATLLHDADHPSLVPPIDVGVLEGVPVAIYPRLRGVRSLATILLQRPAGSSRLPFDAALIVALAVAEAIAAAHDVGLVHGELSTRQVLVTASGEVKVTDFGEYRTSQGTSGVQRSIPLGERLAHVPPEIVSGARPTRASDVFSLGVLLHTLLLGPRFRRDETSDAILDAVREGRVVRPILAPVLSEELANVLHGALARRPEDRLTAGEIVTALRGVLLAANIPDVRSFLVWAARPAPVDADS